MSIGINLRVTGHTSIGGRKYQEDFFSVAYQQTENDQSLEYAFFGIYDGHGGAEAALYAKEHLMNTIVSQKLFWSENDEDVLKAIREGYIQTHYSMWREQDKWPKTSSGLPSTAGTTASIAFIRRGKIYVGHVGDSGIVLGFQKDKEVPESSEICKWGATSLTEDHKPEAYAEKMRIINCGGKVVTKSGVPRVVWNRPRIGHKGPVRRSTPIDEIPFLAVARSLGDLWSYNSAVNEFIVSPNPDVSVIDIDPKKYRCLIFGTDGLWNVLTPKTAVEVVHSAEMENVRIALEGGCDWKNPSKLLVNEALERWSRSNMKADNTSVIVIMLDPPGPPKRDVLRSMRTTIQQIDYEVGCSQPLNNMSITLYDHTTREVIDLSQVTCQEAPAINHEHHSHQQYLDSTASTSYQDMIYTDSFAESYNTFLNSSLCNDHSYTNYTPPQYPLNQHQHQPQPHHHQQVPSPEHRQTHAIYDTHALAVSFLDETRDRTLHGLEETYSLTNLQTKSERMHSEMMKATTSSSTTQHECSGNVTIVENFHDYPLPHATHHHSQHAYDGHYAHHQMFQQHQEQPSYRMERYDYHQPNREEQVGCSYNTQPYTAHDFSEHNYQRNGTEYFYDQTEPKDTGQEEHELEESVESNELDNCFVESTVKEDDLVSTVTCDEINTDQGKHMEMSQHSNSNETEEKGIQIHEISSSNLNVLSPLQDIPNQSDSDCCYSGDEAKASSSTSRTLAVSKKRQETSKARAKKALKHIVQVVYETRSSQRPHRTRALQENVSANRNKTLRNKFGKFLTKKASIKKFLSFKKLKGPVNPNTIDNNNSSANNNNIKRARHKLNTCETKEIASKEFAVEKRVLRSTDQVKPMQRTRRTLQDSSILPNTVNHDSQQKASSLPALEESRKLPKRKIMLRKATKDVKRVRR